MIEYKIEVFEGPLELLLNLIEKNKVNIFDIPISIIIRQYLDYITALQSMDIYIAAEFIDMASRLLKIKSRMLLPKKEDEEDPRQELVYDLMEYSQIKNIAAYLAERYEYFSQREVKDVNELYFNDIYIQEPEEKMLDKNELAGAIADALKKFNSRAADSDESVHNIYKRKRVSANAKLISVLRILYANERLTFFDMLANNDIDEIVLTFSVLLKLIMGGRVYLDSNNFMECYFTLNKNKRVKQI